LREKVVAGQEEEPAAVGEVERLSVGRDAVMVSTWSHGEGLVSGRTGR